MINGSCKVNLINHNKIIKMKTKLILILSGVLLSSNLSHAQSNGDCATKAALAYDNAKANRYEEAYKPLMEVKENCPTYSLATFQYLERILDDKLQKAGEEDKKELVDEMIHLKQERLQYFPSKTSAGDVQSDVAMLQYENGIGTKETQFHAFDDAFKADKESFKSPKAIYAYFSLLVDLQDEGKKTLEDVFENYDQVIAKIEKEENEMAENLAPLMERQDAGETLTAKEQTLVKNSEINLNAYSQVKGSINGKLGQRADCDNLIPLYTKDFDARKTDVSWLQIASGRLSAKDCTDDPIFFKVVEALHKAEPSAKSALYLGQLAEAKGDAGQALKYYNESAELETNPSDKSRVYMKLADNYKKKNNYSQARSYYRKALSAKPSAGRAYLQIASMYAQSANNCGDDAFNKRAVYWLAADYAARAGRVDPSLSSVSNETVAAYKGRAPQKSDIFQAGKGGQTISIGCWIGESVRVPSL